MRLTFTNGPIWTGTSARPDWVTIEGPNIVSMGVGPAPDGDRFDLSGRALLPGFQDAHVHPPIGGLAMIRCELHGVEPDAYEETIAAYAHGHPGAAWILGGGWPMNAFAGGIARKDVLDRVVPDRPVLLHSSEGHAAWVNSAALAVAGIDASTPDPAHGRIERDPDGEPSWTLQEGAVDLVERHAPPDTVDDLVAGIAAAQSYLLSFGITGWQDAWVRPVDHEAYLRLDAAGRLVATVKGALWWDRTRGLEQLDELMERAAHRGRRYRPIGVKLMVDGVIENGTGAMCAPYAGTDDRGLTFLPPELLARVVPTLMAAGLQPHFHAIGDCAIRSALDAVAMGDPTDAVRTRPHIAHIHVIDPTDLPRFAGLGVTANAQALWACNDATMVDLTLPRLGPRRATWQYPFRSLLDAGAILAAGSDWSVSTPDPFAQMAVAVTRRTEEAPEPLLPDQAVTVEEALAAFTIGSAWVNHDEDRAGTIAPGRAADLVVASDDPLAVEDLSAITVEATFVDGRMAFER
jgi:predicted amidohydrolase YtcJ